MMPLSDDVGNADVYAAMAVVRQPTPPLRGMPHGMVPRACVTVRRPHVNLRLCLE